MATYATVAVISNRHLFLWRFLAHSMVNRVTFLLLISNQFVAPIIVALLLRDSSAEIQKAGIEFYVMIAGVMATLIFLLANAISKTRLD